MLFWALLLLFVLAVEATQMQQHHCMGDFDCVQLRVFRDETLFFQTNMDFKKNTLLRLLDVPEDANFPMPKPTVAVFEGKPLKPGATLASQGLWPGCEVELFSEREWAAFQKNNLGEL